MARIRHIAIYAENPNETAASTPRLSISKRLREVREEQFTYPTVISMLPCWYREAIRRPRAFIILVSR